MLIPAFIPPILTIVNECTIVHMNLKAVKSLKIKGFRLRIGNMRAIFEIIDDMVVLKAGYRGNIYER